MSPRILIIRLLEACNAGCFMCSFANSRDGYRFGLSDLRNLLQWVQGSTIRVVRFTGGEPLLVSDLGSMITELRSAGYISSLITNGWFLPDRLDELAMAGINQIIVSLDGATEAAHDRFRRSPGLFARIVSALSRAHKDQPAVRLRVNTVVGPHNLSQLVNMVSLLSDLGVEQWSLIPIKGLSRGTVSLEEHLQVIDEFQAALRSNARAVPQIIAPGLDLLGRTSAEQQTFWAQGRNMTPRGLCHLVDLVRYYTPKDGLVYPCNCIPHRSEGRQHCEPAEKKSFSTEGLVEIRDWLRINGPSTCTGCEPANVALAELGIDLEGDPLGF